MWDKDLAATRRGREVRRLPREAWNPADALAVRGAPWTADEKAGHEGRSSPKPWARQADQALSCADFTSVAGTLISMCSH